jgi:hypothetical protein
MDKYAKLAELLRAVAGNNIMMPLIVADVKAITGESCTVMVGELEVTEVRLKATVNGDGNYLLAEPKVGSRVLVGSLSGDLKELAVIKCDEVGKLKYKQNGLEILVDSADGKLMVKNGTVSLISIIGDLINMMKTEFKVFTPSGPSGTALPLTVTKLTNIENRFKQLLK